MQIANEKEVLNIERRVLVENLDHSENSVHALQISRNKN